MDKWIVVSVGHDETALARPWPGGVLVRVDLMPDVSGFFYMEGWRIKMQTGDMDGNKLEKAEARAPEYEVVARAIASG